MNNRSLCLFGQLGGRLRAAVDGCAHGAYCGMDVGGTDIKLAVSLDGRLIAVKEYDWNPAANPTAEGITAPMLRLIRLMRACVIADGLSKDAECVSLLAAALRKDASGAEMDAAIIACESSAAELPLFSGIGLSFPDVVISDRILGGETPKTKGMRENTALDYETEFAKLDFKSLDFEEKKIVAAEFINRILINENEVNIEWKM